MSNTKSNSGLHFKPHLATVALEDYFQVGTFNQMIQQKQWYRFETRLEQNTQRILDLFARHQIRGTFFVLGWVADRYPELLKKVALAGHELASKGYFHRSVREMTREEFLEDAIRSREAIEHASGQKVFGYRVAHEWFGPQDLWALELLAQAGYLYDSSVVPLGKQFRDEPFRQTIYRHETASGGIWELPVSTTSLMGYRFPIASGNYLRQLPYRWTLNQVEKWAKTKDSPLVMYFHAWELDPTQPTLTAGGRLQRLRHYRNLHKVETRLDGLFKKYPFTNVARYLQLPPQELQTIEPRRYPAEIPPDVTLTPTLEPQENRTPVSIVVPCYNEELILPYMANTLKSVSERLSHKYQITYLLVDDGSKDGTWKGLEETFGDKPGYELYRHQTNRGVAAAILTGIHRAKTEIVCSIDCDCTYDPHSLERMIPKLTDDVDLVTASPYHPEGEVRNVPKWRLKLSKSASWLYRRILKQKLHTYTSCFRVYRRSAIERLDLKHNNFLGIAELVGKLGLQGSKVVEFPATLEVRMLGRSKMKTLRTIMGHLKLMANLVMQKRTPKQTSLPSIILPQQLPLEETAR